MLRALTAPPVKQSGTLPWKTLSRILGMIMRSIELPVKFMMLDHFGRYATCGDIGG